MRRPVGLAGRPAHNPASLISGLRARRTARSTMLKMSNPRQITLISTSIRRLLFKNIGATARGPLKLPCRRSTASWPLWSRSTSSASASLGSKLLSRAYQPSVAASAVRAAESKQYENVRLPFEPLPTSVIR